MSAIAIVGAGSRMGMSIAKIFGRNGFDVALIARNTEKLAGFSAELKAGGINAAGFPADVLDRSALVTALDRAAEQFGGIEVLEYSVPPSHSATGFVAALDVTVENLVPQIECTCYGAVAATRAVLPAMLAAGAGSLLFTTGASSVAPREAFGSAGIAAAALRNWVLNLNSALAGTGVYAGHVPIAVWIGDTPGPVDEARMQPDDIAGVYWDLHTTRDRAEQLVGGA